jgi:hypothetical protein
MRRETAVAETKRSRPRETLPLARARATVRLLESKPRVAASGSRHRFEGHVTLPVPHPRIRRLVGHPAMPGAIGAALRRLNAAIGEFLACRVANRPSAGTFADLLEPDLQHLADLGFGKKPCRLPFARDGRDGGALPQRLRAGDRRPAGSPRARPSCSRRQVMDVAVSLTPIRFALPITALRDGAPSAIAMLLALFPSSAICLRVSIAASVHISPVLRCFRGRSTS